MEGPPVNTSRCPAQFNVKPIRDITEKLSDHRIEEGYFINKNGHMIFCKYWSGPRMKAPKALVFVCHGAGEHVEPYGELAEVLKKQGFFVFGHDHQGHGYSEGPRVHIDNFRDYTRDVMQHVEVVRKKFSSLCPVFILGHSMGGAVALMTVLDNPDCFSGMVLIAPLVTPDNDNIGLIQIAVGTVMAYVWPSCPVMAPDFEPMSRDLEVVSGIKRDPLTYHGWLTAKWALCLLRAVREIERRCSEIKLPFLVLHGGDDKVINSKGCEYLQATSSSTDKTLKIFPEAYHSLHRDIEPIKTMTLNEVKDWLLERTADRRFLG